ncbi:F0F1 ATP synthase subunit epsilon [Alicyclobacillus sp. SO9]|uniref:F0F1 ATP synthase subunit epsilon n=1 Tax=Alicyclobacillus sp. SO9 TaxID=2665646 RepID=UPI0018E7DB13|nr:F0F1 ATP synthase subunit epsilon [Alicyclobacillus sp. SO9]QQE78774.1 F0F1 ATP synthase subunit epsilon [Alicyclobacillus sp. SO9]
MSTVLLEVVTPNKQVLSQEVNMVTLRGGAGDLGILPRHAPLATTVKPGIVKVKLSQGEEFLFVSGGFLEVLPHQITILADAAEIGGQIDVDRARRAQERAEARALQPPENFDRARNEAALLRALKRLEAAELSASNGYLLGREEKVEVSVDS